MVLSRSLIDNEATKFEEIDSKTHVRVTGTGSAATVDSASVSRVASSATVVTLVASNASRKFVILYNDSNKDCYIKFGTAASSTDFTLKMQREEQFYIDGPIYTGIVTGIWTSADGAMQVTEG